MGEIRNACKILFGILKGRGFLGDMAVVRECCNKKLHLAQIEYESPYRIKLVSGRVQNRVPVSAEMNLGDA
jgi:hypothetical protein